MIVLEKDGAAVKSWSRLPSKIELPGRIRVHAPRLGPLPAGHVLKDVADPEPAPPSLDDMKSLVNRERDRRIDAGFEVDFGVIVGVKPFDSDPRAREDITAAQTLALGAILAGAQVGDMRWADPDSDYEWICADNTRLPMDAHTLREFCEAAMSYKSALTLAARTLKDLPQIPEDYANDQYWPSRTLALA